MECQFCKKGYSSKSALLYHQRTTKSCLKIQIDMGVCKKVSFDCSFCLKQLTTKCNLDSHLLICKTKIKEDAKKDADKKSTIKTLKIVEEKQDELEDVSFKLRSEKEQLESQLSNALKEIKKLQDKLDYQEKHPRSKTKNITNHITNNIQNIFEVMTPERVEEFFKKHYNLDILMQGVPGIARFLNDNFIVKSSYICSDRSRHKFIMKDKEGNSVEDTNCKNLLSLTAPGMKHVKDVYETSIFDRHDDFSEEEIHQTYKPISVLHKDPSPLKSELSKIVPEQTSKKNGQVEDDSWMRAFESLDESYIKLHDNSVGVKVHLKLDDKTFQNQKQIDPDTDPVLQTIAGHSLGSLQKYKIGYKERKQKANGEEVDIKGPSSLMKLYETDPVIKEQYDQFIKL